VAAARPREEPAVVVVQEEAGVLEGELKPRSCRRPVLAAVAVGAKKDKKEATNQPKAQ
jgi:hypothetical protein